MLFLWLGAVLPMCAQTGFVHPGLLQSREDLARMKIAVAAKQEPIISGYNVFRAHPQSQTNYVPHGPFAEIGRNPNVHFGDYDQDANAACQCAIMWTITGDHAYADKARSIISAWTSTLKKVSGRDAVLMAGLGPFKMINAAGFLRRSRNRPRRKSGRRARDRERTILGLAPCCSAGGRAGRRNRARFRPVRLWRRVRPKASS